MKITYSLATTIKRFLNVNMALFIEKIINKTKYVEQYFDRIQNIK